jgi:hypothetical protein
MKIDHIELLIIIKARPLNSAGLLKALTSLLERHMYSFGSLLFASLFFEFRP